MSNENEHCSNGCEHCECTTSQKSLDWSDMLEISCKHLGKWGVYANYTGSPDSQSTLESLCAKFFTWCDKQGISHEESQNFASELMFGKAVLFETSKQAGAIYRFFNEPGVYASPWFACLVSPTEGIVEENT